MSRSNAILVGISSLTVGFLFANVFLIIAGALILVNENADREDEENV